MNQIHRTADGTNLDDAATFLRTLVGEPDPAVTFQTFDDAKDRRDPQLARILHGHLSDLADQLAGLNARRAGVYVMVNEGDGNGRGAENVTGLRALFVDDDAGKLDPSTLPLAPSLVVRSKAGVHAYWLLAPGEDLAAFKPAQGALARRLGTDPRMDDLPRVLRVPGFLHHKAEPFPVRLVSVSSRRYTIREVLDGLGAKVEEPAPSAPRTPHFAADGVTAAVERYNADHRRELPPHNRPGPCPICGGGASFHESPAGSGRWYCFSSHHPPSVGRRGESGYHGDALDLDAHAAGLDRMTVLREAGYWTSRVSDRPGAAPGDHQGEDQAQATPPREVLGAERWAWLRERGGWLAEAPPARTYLLAAPGGGGRGMLPLGKVGMLAAGGGMGKSWALTQLALCVATGRPWLGTYPVASPGPVLLALAEEEEEEIRRRLYYGARSLGLRGDDLRQAEARILPLPLCGEHVALTYSPEEIAASGRRVNPSSPDAVETPFARAIRDKLDGAGVEWRLLVLDPVSRFAGPDVEKENAAATRFVQTLERLTRVPGGPTVLVAHHTNKTARGSEVTDSTAARGASAITDGVRWQANIETVLLARPKGEGKDTNRRASPDLARFAVVKSNYAAKPEPLYLRRDPEDQGSLVPITEREAKAQIAAAERDAEGTAAKGEASLAE